MAFTAAQAVARPFKHAENNIVDFVCKSVLVLFLIFATSYIDYDSINQSDVQDTNEIYGTLTVVLVCSATAFAVLFFLRWSICL